MLGLKKCCYFPICIFVIVATVGGKAVDTRLKFVPADRELEPQQTWDYVNVRAGAHMFWWLYYSTAAEGYKNRPLVIWLQGGPGGSSTGFGNFEEIGPQDVKLNPRKTNWVSQVSVLFVDNPVGTGFSYVDYPEAFTTNSSTIASDLVVMLQHFMGKVPEFQTIPLYIFSESYGGKMASAFSLALYKAIKAGSVECNFKGVALGDSWISPVDSVMSWGPYLRTTSLIDKAGSKAVNKGAQDVYKAVESGQFAEATQRWSVLEDIIEEKTSGVNFYNILKWNSDDASINKFQIKKNIRDSKIAKLYSRHVSPLQDDDLSELMNGVIRKKLRIIPEKVKWGGQSGEVFEKLSTDFMKPVINIVDELLKTTDLKVVVYSGQLDLIVDTLGTEMWVQKLTWPGLSDFNEINHKAILGKEGTPAAFSKTYKNFSFFWILNAGHMVPADAGETALTMLKMVTKV